MNQFYLLKVKWLAAAMLACSLSFSPAQTQITWSPDSLLITGMEFDTSSPKTVTAQELFYSLLGLSSDNSFIAFDSSAITEQLFNRSCIQYYKGIEVEQSLLRLHYQNGKLRRFLGEYVPIHNFDTACAVSPDRAKSIYRQHFPIMDSINQDSITFTVYKVFIAHATKEAIVPALCYKIAARELPLQAGWLYINIKTGHIEAEMPAAEAAVETVPVELQTLYSGNRHLELPVLNHEGGSYVLCVEESPMLCLQNSALNTPYSHNELYAHYRDNDNAWGSAEHPATVHAHDVFWGLYNIVHYFRDVHNFGTYGSAIAFIDYREGRWSYCDNAAAVDYQMDPSTASRNAVFVIGQPLFGRPFASIDILAHEYAHYMNKIFRLTRLNTQTSTRETATALSEGLGDIWGAVLEFLYAPEGDNCWKIGEKPLQNSLLSGFSCLRDMKNPGNSTARTPMSGYYQDVAFNSGNAYVKSGVLSHWFYYVVEGNGCFKGIGMAKAAQLIYRAQRYYLVPLTLLTAVEDMYSIKDNMALAVSDLVNSGLLTAEDAVIVEKAWAAVGVYGANMPEPVNTQAIEGNVVWNTPKNVNEPIIIKANATLTITSTCYCAPDAEFIIQQGGKLIVDGGTLTSQCEGQMWKGIAVLGHSNASQFDFTADGQGQLYIRNGATVEHAVCAIRNYDILNGSADLSTTGGNISAGNSRFIDNAQMVSLAPYTHSDSRATSFANCEFTIQPAYSFDHPVSKSLVDIKEVKKVYFDGCDFSYPCYAAPDYPDPNTPLIPGARAIYAFNAEITVQARNLSPYCLGCNNYDSCRFTGFETAIEVWYSGNSTPAKIDRTDFNRNNQGVVLH
ncbi:MAG: M4 family metallopeptidase, partial [Bacteroidales bacterium]|nr:M4 family metallopeptidase [Bacteroidales bacterium]